MTDRQTANGLFQQRGVWWIGTAYDNNILKLEDAKLFPKCVKKVHGGREQCPTTGRLHFQFAIECHGQQRAVFFRDWMPGVHFEKARCAAAAKAYALKQDTAVGPKQSVENPVKYLTMDDILLQLAICYYEGKESGTIPDKSKLSNHDLARSVKSEDSEEEFWDLAVALMRKNGRHLASSLANPAVRKMWIHTKVFWMEEALSITEPLDNEVENEIVEN